MTRAWDATPRTWDDDPDRTADSHINTGRLVFDFFAAPEIDYMPTVNPDKPRPANAPPADLLDMVLADAISDLDRARGEYALLAEPGTSQAQIADRRETQWRALHPGFAQLIDELTKRARTG